MTCESCGAEVAEVIAVHRKYLLEADGERLLDEVEHWCLACLTHYPHEPA
ncbi:MAG TPA: hypothetical protein VIS05_00250 [Ilumatobacter sp.]